MRTEEQKRLHTKYMQEYYKIKPWKKFYNKVNQRCNNPRCDKFKYYGGKGIKALLTEEEIDEYLGEINEWMEKRRHK